MSGGTIGPSGEGAIAQELDIAQLSISDEQSTLEDGYEVLRTVSEIEQGGYKVVGLQFPDELLHDSVAVYHAIRSRLADEVELYVLADTTYGSCCVDEVAAQHVDADLVVHYGHACLSPTARLPVIYVLTKRAIDAVHAASQLASTSKQTLEELSIQRVVVMYDVAYDHAAPEVEAELRKVLELPIVGERIDQSVSMRSRKGKEAATEEDVASPPAVAEESQETKEATAIFYIGPPSLRLTNLLLSSSGAPSSPTIFSYSPVSKTCQQETGTTNKLLMRRYALVQRAKDADVVGILVGTLGVAQYLPLIDRLRKTIEKRQKKSYTISVGKLNPAKLANFTEIGVFVLVACPENSIVLEAKEFLRPIVTPFEMLLALEDEDSEWTWGSKPYTLDFGRVLSSAPTEEDEDDRAHNSDDEEAVFSATTGKYRQRRVYERYDAARAARAASKAPQNGTAVALRNQSSALTAAQQFGSASAEALAGRTWRGLSLEQDLDRELAEVEGRELGREDLSVVQEGRSGVARGYTDER